MEEFFDNELAKKFEEMIQNREEIYFDTEEMEDIIIFYLELGDIAYAEMAANHATKLHPASLEIKTKKLEVLLELESYQEAKRLIAELREAGVEDTDFFVCCAKYYSNLGNPRRAIEYCEKALELKEEENFLHNFIADEYTNLEDPFNALKHYKLALQEDPQDGYALESIMQCYNVLNRSEEAIAFLNEYLDEFAFSEIAWQEYAQYYFNKKNYEEALKGFDYLLAINSSSVGVHANKAACYEAMKQWDKALSVYTEMLEMEFTTAYTLYRIGLCHRELGQPMAALQAFQKALREDPQFYLAMMEQSHLYEEMGAKTEALHFAKEAVALNGSNLEFQKRLAYLYIDDAQFEESLPSLKKLVDMEPGRFYNWYAYAEVLMLVEDYATAMEVLLAALQKHGRAELYYQMSNCLFQLEQDDAAHVALQKAMEIDPALYEDMKMKYPTIKGEERKKKSKKK